jgi:hypothetical protein
MDIALKTESHLTVKGVINGELGGVKKDDLSRWFVQARTARMDQVAWEGRVYNSGPPHFSVGKTLKFLFCHFPVA